jgi:hypothetical protein
MLKWSILLKLYISQIMSTDNKGRKDRIYYSMLEKVGTLGRYQLLLSAFIVLIGMEGSACLLVNPYIFY